MGCSSSSNPAIEASRRRLSVGAVDKVDSEPYVKTTEADRGLLSSLADQDIMDALKTSDVNGRKVSIGSSTDAGKVSFANKTIQQVGDDMDPASCGLGYTCRKGLKPESPNQDSWMVLKLDACSMYGVFDGHGHKGHDVSNFVKDTLPKLVIKDRRFKEGDYAGLLVDVFLKTQSLILAADAMEKLSAQASGTTASVAIHDHAKNKITIAHVADSTVVLGKQCGDSNKLEGEQLTRDHKPDLKDERARIEKMGGRVVFDGYANHRVFAKKGRYPGLNMSRCLGDLKGHQDCGIIAEPEIKELTVLPEHRLLLLCSDGVWEFCSPTEAVSIVNEFPATEAMTAAEKLAKQAWDRWISEEGGLVVDDITVVLVHLHYRRSQSERTDGNPEDEVQEILAG
eukprot:TRINITY_DN23885_c0_g1_i1.p1 TRINITY_DN23885_c0_g1~~TRINITY_DN23885_c0_g1_i1.p1  ORF type:complete len:397 (+),score=72.52 TRINITY_DN23885_c0_g1_i1:36-1226(+)